MNDNTPKPKWILRPELRLARMDSHKKRNDQNKQIDPPPILKVISVV